MPYKAALHNWNGLLKNPAQRLALLAGGRRGQNFESRILFGCRKSPKMAQNSTRQVHALFGGAGRIHVRLEDYPHRSHRIAASAPRQESGKPDRWATTNLTVIRVLLIAYLSCFLVWRQLLKGPVKPPGLPHRSDMLCYTGCHSNQTSQPGEDDGQAR